MNGYGTSIRLRFLLQERDQRGANQEEVLSVYRDLGVIPKDDRDDNFNKTPEDLSNYKLVLPGDVVVNKMKAWQGSVAVSNYRGIVSGDYLVCKVIGQVDHRFLHHLLRSRPLIDEYGQRSTGIRPSQWRLYWDDFADVRVNLPPLEVQASISAYLDNEIARLDALITKKRRMIELASERLRLVARDWTTRSGRVVPLRRHAIQIKTGTTPSQDQWEMAIGNEVPWYSPGDFGQWLSIGEPSRTLSSQAITSGWVPRFPPDSTLVIGIGGAAGRVAHLSDHEATGNQQLTCIVSDHHLVSRFLSWQLFARSEEMRLTAPFTTLPILNNDFLKSFHITVPTLDEQKTVVKALDSAAKGVLELTTKLQQQITLLLEYRQGLITASVTGKLQISGATV